MHATEESPVTCTHLGTETQRLAVHGTQQHPHRSTKAGKQVTNTVCTALASCKQQNTASMDAAGGRD